MLEKAQQDFSRVSVIGISDGHEASLRRLFPQIEMVATPKELSYLGLFAQSFIHLKKDSIVLSFTVPANLIVTFWAYFSEFRYLLCFTGLGSSFLSKKIWRFLIINCFRILFKDKSGSVVFQNESDARYFRIHHIFHEKRIHVISGSGVSGSLMIKNKALTEKQTPKYDFGYVGRLIADKGIQEFLDAIELFRENNIPIRCLIVGNVDAHNFKNHDIDIKILLKMQEVEWVENAEDVLPYIDQVECLVLPSYREGLSRALIEGLARRKILVASRVPGCRELVNHGVNGFLCVPRSEKSLYDAMLRVLELDCEERLKMGDASLDILMKLPSEEIVSESLLKLAQG